jgi:hypothetical protein
MSFGYVPPKGSGIGQDNFSYFLVEDGKTVVIPFGQQMVLDGHLTVRGHLSVRGEIVNVSNRTKEQFFYRKIAEDDVVTVEKDRLLLYKDNITVCGHLRVIGELAAS